MFIKFTWSDASSVLKIRTLLVVGYFTIPCYLFDIWDVLYPKVKVLEELFTGRSWLSCARKLVSQGRIWLLPDLSWLNHILDNLLVGV